MKHIRLGFADFSIMWGPWPSPVDFFVNMLKSDFDIEVTNDNPDFLMCSWPGEEHRNYSCPKIFYSGENRPPDFETYNWCMTHDFCDDPHHYRLPIYLLFGDAYQLLQPKPPIDQLWNREFCCVMFGKRYPFQESPREDFFHRLCNYKKVHSFGPHFNNMGTVIPIEGKIEACKNYKFVLSFENHAVSGWTTEKIFMAMLANSVPVYWGNPEIGQEFNHRSFVNCQDGNWDAAIQRIKELDQDKERYAAIMNEPYFTGNQVNEFACKENILKFFHRIFD